MHDVLRLPSGAVSGRDRLHVQLGQPQLHRVLRHSRRLLLHGGNLLNSFASKWSRRVRRALTAAVLAAVTSSAAHAAPPSFKVLQEVKLPDTIALAGDVRWASDDSLFIAAGRAGVKEVTLAGVVKTPEAIPGQNKDRSRKAGPIPNFHHAWYLGASAEQLVVASPFRSFAWKPRKGGRLIQEPFATSVDIDVWRNRVVLLGVPGDNEGRWPTSGYTVWTADLSASDADMESVNGGPQIKPLSYCHILDPSAVRFFPDGRFAVALGVEPGVKLYDANRRLLRTWPTSSLGYLDNCPLTEPQSNALGMDLKGRADWINRRETLDEMLALPEGPLLVIRKATPKGTEWRGVLLPIQGGAPVKVALPISSPSRLAHAKADLRGDRVVFLVMEHTLSQTQKPVPTRAVVTRLQR